MTRNKKAKKRFSIGRLTTRTMMIALASALVLTFLSFLVDPSKLWFVSLLGLCFVPLFLLNALVFVLAVIRRSGSFLIPLVAMTPAFLAFGLYFQLFSGGQSREGGTDVKILTYNVGRFSGSKLSPKEAMDSIFNFISKQDADIICLQEFQAKNLTNIRQMLRQRLPGYNVEYYAYSGSKESFGNVTLSRFKSVSKGKIDFAKGSNLALWVDYKIGEEIFRVYNCHLQSYALSLPSLAQKITGGYKDAWNYAEKKMKPAISLRPKEVEQLIQNIENSGHKTFVIGDFNDNPLSYTFRRLIKNRKDSFVEAGRGAGATFTIFWPMIRIDYILYPQEMKAVSHKVIKKKFSDHYPVVASINIQ